LEQCLTNSFWPCATVAVSVAYILSVCREPQEDNKCKQNMIAQKIGPYF
jgi:hypothetical protein